MPPPLSLPVTISLLTLPPLLLSTYLYNYPLPPHLTQRIRTSTSLPHSVASSPSYKITNPKNHIAMTDSISFVLPLARHPLHSKSNNKYDPNQLSDTQLLSRFLRGFFTGRIFYPEYLLLNLLHLVGSRWLVVGIDEIPSYPNGNHVISNFSRSELPPLYSVYLDHFMVLDSRVLPATTSPQEIEKETVEGQEQQQGEQSSYVDIAFGDNRKRFGGFHRFEVLRAAKEGVTQKERSQDGDEPEERKTEEVTIRYSCMACDPQVDGWRPWILWHLHRVYALSLFRDGAREVLSG